MCEFGWVNLCCIFYFYASLFSYLEQVLSCLVKEVYVGYFFRVVVPVPDFQAMTGCVGDDGFSFQGWVVAEEHGLFWVQLCHLEVVYLCNV